MPLTRMLHFLCSGNIRPTISAPLESSQSPQNPPLYTWEDMELRLARAHADNPISIQRAESKHLTSMARIHVAAFRNDDCVRSLYSDDVAWRAIDAMLGECLENRPYAFRVAMNEKQGRVVGWLCCSVVGDPGIPEWDGLARLAWTIAAAFKASDAQRQLTRSSGESEGSSRHAQRSNLRDGIVSRTKVAQSLAMGDDVYLVINNVVVDPKNDLGGPLTKLICDIMNSADRDGLSIFCHVPYFAVADFEWAGFQKIAGFEPKLDTHQLHFMVRRPRVQ